MSYDLHLFQSKPGEDLEVTARASYGRGSEELDPGLPTPEAEARKRDLVLALQAVNPVLQPFAFDHAELARLEGISESEARRRWRHVELNGAEDGNGIQLMLFDDTASVTVPYWHHGYAAWEVWREIWDYLRVLEREGGYRAYDPQLERVLDLGTDFDAVTAAYAKGVEFNDRVAAEIQAGRVPGRLPWWRFW